MFDFAYAQPRLQARHAARPDELLWRALSPSVTLSHFLDAARKTRLKGWVQAIHPAQAAAEIERALAASMARYVRETGAWLPSRWQPSTDFCAAHSLSLTWVLSQEQWRELWPRVLPSQRAGLLTLVDAVADYRHALARLDASGTAERERMQGRLTQLFRKHTEQPASLYLHLLLVELDVLRLRAELLARALFEGLGGRSWA